MDIDITPVDEKNVDIPFFLKFADEELIKHISSEKKVIIGKMLSPHQIKKISKSSLKKLFH